MSLMKNENPLNTRLPPEWTPQQAIMLTWPHQHSDWQPWLQQVEPVFVAIAQAVAERENLIISAYDAEHLTHIQILLQQAGINPERIRLYIAPSNDTWVRDHGPLTVTTDGTLQLLDFSFNGWGGKFDASLDNTLTRRLHTQGAFDATPITTLEFVLEGGSLEVDGAGSLLTTEHCLLSPQRNPTLTRDQIESHLREWLGVTRVLWLRHGYLAGDDTDSHIDTLARFCATDTICYVACDDPHDEHYAELNAMAQELRALRTVSGIPYRLVALPWPKAKYGEAGKRLPASYANFLIINGAVLAPTYDDPADAAALAALQSCFPDRRIIAIPCLPLIRQYGSLHCVTMQIPTAVL